MDDLESKINGILSSPEQMEKLMGMAKALSGTLGLQEESEMAPDPEPAPFAGLDPKMLRLFTRLMGQYSASASNEKGALLTTLQPYLKEERRDSLQKAMQIARLARLARTAFSELSGGEPDL